jgi:hypothetical protein
MFMNYPKQSSFQKPEEKSSLLNDKPGAISPARVQKLRQKSDLEALSGMQIRVEEIKTSLVEAGDTTSAQAEAMVEELRLRIAPSIGNPDGLRK